MKSRTAQYFPDIGRLAAGPRYLDRWNFRQLPLLNASLLITATAPTLAQMALRARANRDWEIAGTNAADGDQAFATDGLGGIELETAGASGDQVILQPHQDALQSALKAVTFDTSMAPAFYTRIQTAANIADLTIWAGLKKTNTPVTATDTDQAFFRYQDSQAGGSWQLNTSIADDDKEVDSALDVVASTTYELAVVISRSQRRAYYSIAVDGAEFIQYDMSPAMTAGVDLIPFLGIQANAAAAKNLTVREIAVGVAEL